MMNRPTRLTLLLAFALAVAATKPAFSQSVPYKGSGQDSTFEPGTGLYYGGGNGTHVGNHWISGQVIPDGAYFPEPGVFFAGTFTGRQITTAADGSTFEAELSGEVILRTTDSGLVTGTWFPHFEITGGTGRFANASGAFDGVAINPPFNPFTSAWAFDWYVDGEIDLGRRK